MSQQNPMSQTEDFSCITYTPGHHVHWIQALRSGNQPGPQLRVDALTRIDEHNGLLLIDGESRPFWTHDAGSFTAYLAEYIHLSQLPEQDLGQLHLDSRWGVLRLATDTGFRLLCPSFKGPSTCHGVPAEGEDAPSPEELGGGFLSFRPREN